MPIWIRAKSTAWCRHGNAGRPLISYHMKWSGGIWTTAASPSEEEAKAAALVTLRPPLCSSSHRHVPEPWLHAGGGLAQTSEGAQGREVNKGWVLFPLWFSPLHKAYCIKECMICCFGGLQGSGLWPWWSQDWPQGPGKLSQWCWCLPGWAVLSVLVLPGAVGFPWAISGHTKPGSPFPKRKHRQVREVCWPPAQLPSRASIHLQPRLRAYVPVTAVMDFSYRAQDVLFSPLAKTPLGDIWQMASPAPRG